MSRGNIQRRGKHSWRIRFEDGVDAAGRRKKRSFTFKGKRHDAQRELTRLLSAANAGTLPEPSKTNVTEYLRASFDGYHGLSPKTIERYRELAEGQIIPHLGGKVMQRLKPHEIDAWHATLLKSGARTGGPLSARTVGHAHRVLHRALQRAVESEVLSRNVASVKPPPKVDDDEVEILDSDKITLVIGKLAEADHPLHDIVVVDLGHRLAPGRASGTQAVRCRPGRSDDASRAVA